MESRLGGTTTNGETLGFPLWSVPASTAGKLEARLCGRDVEVFMLGLGFQEILLLFVIALLLFGSARPCEVVKRYGKSNSSSRKRSKAKKKKRYGKDRKQCLP